MAHERNEPALRRDWAAPKAKVPIGPVLVLKILNNFL